MQLDGAKSERRETVALRGWERLLDEAFARADYREAHAHARPTLREMVATPGLLAEILLANLRREEFFQQVRNNPVVALPVIENPRYTLVANCWFPHPEHALSLSHQSIHHHGHLLLTTAAALGPGYRAMNFVREGEGIQARFRLLEEYQNDRGRIEFVDAHVPHLVFYPRAISVTYALWSRPGPARGDWARAWPLAARWRKPAARLLRAAGLGHLAGLNDGTGYDFQVENGRIVPLRERATYLPGSRENHQRALRELALAFDLPDGPERRRLEQATAHLPQGSELEPAHRYVPGANLWRKEVLDALARSEH